MTRHQFENSDQTAGRLIKLRDYQHDVIAAFDREVAAGSRRVLLYRTDWRGQNLHCR